MLRLLALLVALPVAAWAQDKPPPLSPEDAKLVYQELLSTHDGFVYTLHILRYSSEEAANRNWEGLQKPPRHMQRFDRVFPGLKARTLYLFTFEPRVRERLVVLYDGQRAGPVAAPSGWYILELLARRAAQPPSFQEVEPNLAGLVAAGALPSATELKANPALRARTAANGIRTVDALNAAPDLDVNIKLSDHDTLLLRALVLGRLDLVDALLKRGADPNLCARQLCPLHSAIYSRSRPAIEALLKSGADPNQTDANAGAPGGPLGAAAVRGDLEVADRLIAVGARVDGEPTGETPLMAAASAANRPMVELLVAKGADLFKLDGGRLPRGPLDSALNARNAEFADWLRGLMLKKAADSGQYAWQGWIEQDGKRQAIEGRPMELRKAPFRIVVRMRPERALYVAAATGSRLFDEFRTQPRDGALFSPFNVAVESQSGKMLVVHGAYNDERWGGSQSWMTAGGQSNFSTVSRTPEGVDHVREIAEIALVEGNSKIDEVPVESYPRDSVFLVVGTRIRMAMPENAVFGARNVELRFR